MTDYSDLKLLAEAATAGPWASSGNWVSTSKGNSVADCPRGDESFIAAANPAAVLALVAENERLQESHEQVCTNYNQVSYASEERGKQIDQLKAENEALRRGMKGDYDLDAWLEWTKEKEALQMDAERYRWLKDKNSNTSIVSSSEKYAKYFFEFMLCGDDLDTVVDAAMSKKS